MAEQKFSHLDSDNRPTMVDVSSKSITKRIATAEVKVILPPQVLEHIRDDELQSKKGPVLQTAILAGIMGAKKTSDLIPLCHPLPLENCEIKMHFNDQKELVVRCTADTSAKTGVEMEALTGASVAALTIYDMCKAFSHDITITDLRLISKSGGKKDFDREG